VHGEAIAVWMEFGRWVFAFYRNGKLLYSQATSSGGSAPDGRSLKEIHLALGQLAIQGLQLKPEIVHLWSPEGDAGSAGSLAGGFHVPVKVTPRPDPVLPEPRSKLLPADVRAARRAAQARQQKLAVVALVVLAYVGVAGWYGYGLWKDKSQIKKLTAEANAIAPAADRAAYENHLATWDELDLVVDGNKAPVDLMSRVAKAIPLNQSIRLKVAEISANEIKLSGEGQQAAPVSQFSVNLSRSMPEFKWENPPPSNSSKGWNFNFTGIPPDTTQ